MSDQPPDALDRAEARRWLDEAHEELNVVAHLKRDTSLPARVACFHANLAAEKALKALLIARGVVLRRLHDLIALHMLLPEIDQERFDAADLDALNPWTIEGRYPADLADTAGDHVDDLRLAAHRVVAASDRALEDSDPGGGPVKDRSF